jgi:nucleoside-diphosphate-sugar epimerase
VGKKVLVIGASGLVGFEAARYFSDRPGCEVTVVSRRPPHDSLDARFVALDLADDAACAEVLAREAAGTTHLVYAALYEKPQLVAGWLDQEHIATNTRMFRIVLDAVDGASPDLRHVTMLEGGKSYGVHVRQVAIPSREGRDDARDLPMFYWPQQDYLRAMGAERAWHWTIFRPASICGESFASAMNPIPALGAYAAVLKAEGQPLHYPGGETTVAQATDAELLAHAIAWAGEAPAARDQVFNMTNGDVFMWEAVWPALAKAFGMEPGGRVPMRLATEMPARAAVWDRVRAEHELRSPDLERFVGLSFQYIDSLLGIDDPTRVNPAVMSPIKLHEAGFHEVVDTERSMTQWLRRFQDKRYLPPASWRV